MAVDLGRLFNLPSDQLYGPTGNLTLPTLDGGVSPLEQKLRRLYPGAVSPGGLQGNDAEEFANLREALLYGQSAGPLQGQLSQDPETQRILGELTSNATRTDANSPLGDNFLPALAITGAAIGGAGAFGAFGAGAGGAAGAAPGVAGTAASDIAPVALSATPTISAPVLAGAGGTAAAGGTGAGLATAGSGATTAGGAGLGLKDVLGLAATGAAVGGTIASGLEQNKALTAQTDIADRQTAIAEALYNRSGPLRDLSYDQLQTFLQTGQVPPGVDTAGPNLYGLDEFLQTGTLPPAVSLAPSTAYNRDVLEQQFQRAREATISQAPAQGGRLAASLTDLEGQRALGVTQLEAQANQEQRQLGQQLYGVGLDLSREQDTQEQQLRRALLASALGVGQGNATTALTGLSGASNSFGAIAAGRLGQTNQLADLAGTLAGFSIPELYKPEGDTGVSTPGQARGTVDLYRALYGL